MRCATRLIPSASASEEPPYFCTIRFKARCSSGAAMVANYIGSRYIGRRHFLWLYRTRPRLDRWNPESTDDQQRVADLRSATRLAGDLFLGDVEPRVRDDGVQRPQGRAAVRPPLVDIGVLPPPQRLRAPAGLVVP